MQPASQRSGKTPVYFLTLIQFSGGCFFQRSPRAAPNINKRTVLRQRVYKGPRAVKVAGAAL